jgi:hypothetical protein
MTLTPPNKMETIRNVAMRKIPLKQWHSTKYVVQIMHKHLTFSRAIYNDNVPHQNN